MKDLNPNEYQLFLRDLKDLKSSKLIASSEVGKFVKTVETEKHVVYVYERTRVPLFFLRHDIYERGNTDRSGRNEEYIDGV